jgi:hypothetical protein
LDGKLRNASCLPETQELGESWIRGKRNAAEDDKEASVKG